MTISPWLWIYGIMLIILFSFIVHNNSQEKMRNKILIQNHLAHYECNPTNGVVKVVYHTNVIWKINNW